MKVICLLNAGTWDQSKKAHWESSLRKTLGPLDPSPLFLTLPDEESLLAQYDMALKNEITEVIYLEVDDEGTLAKLASLWTEREKSNLLIAKKTRYQAQVLIGKSDYLRLLVKVVPSRASLVHFFLWSLARREGHPVRMLPSEKWPRWNPRQWYGFLKEWLAFRFTLKYRLRELEELRRFSAT